MAHSLALASRPSASHLAGLRARYLLFWGVGAIGVVHVTRAFEGAGLFSIRVGSIELYLFDLLALTLGGIGAFLMLRRRRYTLNDALFMLIVGLSVVEFIGGFATFGTQAGVEFRQDAFVLSGLLFMMGTSSYYTHTRRDFMTIVAIYAGGAILIYIMRSLGLASLSQYDLTYNLGIWRSHRFIGADEALGTFGLAVTCFSLAICGDRAARPRHPDTRTVFWMVGLICLLLSFIAMHRSVWAVLLVVLPVFFFLQTRHRLLNRRGYEVVLVGGFLVLFFVVGVILTSATVESAISEVSSRSSTMAWRTQGWESLLALLRPADYIFGRGYGADYTRWVLGRFINNSAHSFYIGKIWQNGVIGLLLYLTLYVRVIRALSRIAKHPASLEERSLATLLTSLLVGELVYFVVYANWIPSVLVFGYALGFVRTKEVARATQRLPADSGRR